jgi:AcrR family transcriptional regulator
MRVAQSRVERQAETRTRLVDAAERLFIESGFGSTSLESVASAAGYTKGAVYSNFASKEDLFFAVYERRVDRFLARVERMLAEAADAGEVVTRMASEALARSGREDGWLAVFFEFWTHVLRHPEHRARFAAAHARATAPLATTLERFAEEQDVELPLDAGPLSVAMFAMVSGLSLERLTQPEAVDAELSRRISDLWLEALAQGRLPAARARGG